MIIKLIYFDKSRIDVKLGCYAKSCYHIFRHIPFYSGPLTDSKKRKRRREQQIAIKYRKTQNNPDMYQQDV